MRLGILLPIPCSSESFCWLIPGLFFCLVSGLASLGLAVLGERNRLLIRGCFAAKKQIQRDPVPGGVVNVPQWQHRRWTHRGAKGVDEVRRMGFRPMRVYVLKPINRVYALDEVDTSELR